MNVSDHRKSRSSRVEACAEIALICTLFFVLVGTPPPDVNEADYVTKAKHYWNPGWCSRDHFLDSGDAHLLFYWTIGWLTRLLSLPAATWVGRILNWALLAWAWRRLSFALVPARMYSVLGAALFMTLLRWGHMSGEWVVGGLEGKGFAYVFVLLGLESLIRHRWRRACLHLSVAAAFHVVVGGWAFIAAAFSWCMLPRDQRLSLWRLTPALIVAGIISLGGIVPGLALSWSADSATVEEANRIYVFGRLSHHLVFHALPHLYIARHVLLIVVWGAIVRWLPRVLDGEHSERFAKLNRFVLGAVILAVLGAFIDQSLLYFRSLAAALLRYYWFRLSDVMVPIGVTFGVLGWLASLARDGSTLPWLRHPIGHPRDQGRSTKAVPSSAYAGCLTALLLLVSGDVLYVVLGHFRDPRPGAIVQAMPAEGVPRDELLRRYRDWQRVCLWIRDNTPNDRTFLTPRHQQTFQWYAERAEVVSSKHLPQDAASIVEWRRRLDEVFPWTVRYADLAAHGEQRLIELARKYRFHYVVLDRSVSQRRLNFERVYPAESGEQSTFEVYLIPPGATS